MQYFFSFFEGLICCFSTAKLKSVLHLNINPSLQSYFVEFPFSCDRSLQFIAANLTFQATSDDERVF